MIKNIRVVCSFQCKIPRRKRISNLHFIHFHGIAFRSADLALLSFTFPFSTSSTFSVILAIHGLFPNVAALFAIFRRSSAKQPWIPHICKTPTAYGQRDIYSRGFVFERSTRNEIMHAHFFFFFSSRVARLRSGGKSMRDWWGPSYYSRIVHWGFE